MPVTNSYESWTNTPATTPVITAPSTSPWRGYTAGLPWYNSTVVQQVWLGNGTDQNLVYDTDAQTFGILNAGRGVDPYDPSQQPFPPCTSWVRNESGEVYGAGNVTNPLRVWATEPPNANYPVQQGLKTLLYSFTDLQVKPLAVTITGLGLVGNRLVAHMSVGPPLGLSRINLSSGGWKFDQIPFEAYASAINPSCLRDNDISPFYLGNDLEIYSPKQSGAYDKVTWRDTDIVTGQASGNWNRQALKPVVPRGDYNICYDEKNGRFWVWLVMAATGRIILYCYDQRGKAVTGPWHYPDFQTSCQMLNDDPSCLLVGITRDGALLWADVDAVGKQPYESYTDPVGVQYQPTTVPPTITTGLPYCAVDATGRQFMEVLNGVSICMANPFADWTLGTIVPAQYFQNGKISVIELAEQDFGAPDVEKEFVRLRSLVKRNSRIYVGVYVEANGYQTYGGFRGLYFPQENFSAALGGMAAIARIRIIVISFNDQPGRLMSATPEFLLSVED